MTHVENLPSIVRCGLVPGGVDGGKKAGAALRGICSVKADERSNEDDATKFEDWRTSGDHLHSQCGVQWDIYTVLIKLLIKLLIQLLIQLLFCFL